MCHFCGLELKTAAGLRKHVSGHERDGLGDIKMAPGYAGKQRRALLSIPHVLTRQQYTWPVAPVTPPQTGRVQRHGDQDLAAAAVDAHGRRLLSKDTARLVEELRRENAQLTAGNEALKARLQGLTMNKHKHKDKGEGRCHRTRQDQMEDTESEESNNSDSSSSSSSGLSGARTIFELPGAFSVVAVRDPSLTGSDRSFSSGLTASKRTIGAIYKGGSLLVVELLEMSDREKERTINSYAWRLGSS
ncbi:hypothetical protein F5B21DRAFT_525399 [Xylaria acuta]|nr:hypothetical protein F5B21DRAFT_525399 [Xylaria acuta]